MALRKNNKSDFAKFSNTNKDVLGNDNKNNKDFKEFEAEVKALNPEASTILAGENTDVVKKDSQGKDYALYGASWGSDNIAGQGNVMEGDTIFPNKSNLVNSGGDDYIMGGDYYADETGDSKKRSGKTPKSFKIK